MTKSSLETGVDTHKKPSFGARSFWFCGMGRGKSALTNMSLKVNLDKPEGNETRKRKRTKKGKERGAGGVGRACIDGTSLNVDLTSLKESPRKRKRQGTKGCEGCGVGGKGVAGPKAFDEKP